jgi:NTP pyrophosphatase (non-canonical NTP hydrolase)
MTDKEFFDALTKYHNGKEPLFHTAAVLSYESGKVLEQAMYLHWKGYDPARIGFLKSELMDVIAQTILICESLGVPFNEMREMGIEKAMERFTRKEIK